MRAVAGNYDQEGYILTGNPGMMVNRCTLSFGRCSYRAAEEAIGEYLIEAQNSWKEITENYRCANPPLEPAVTLFVNARSLEFVFGYVVYYMKRTSVKDQLFTKIVEEVAKSKGARWASTKVATVT